MTAVLRVTDTLIGAALGPPVLSMRQWAEDTIIIPDGPFKGEPFRVETQPFSGLYLDAVDSRKWPRVAAVGPQQTGKSLLCYVLPVLYHLFGLNETVVAGVPTLLLANDKWEKDFRPTIDASPELAALLPIRGPGSRGGTVREGVTFRNGATLKFMGGGGSDKTRSSYTTRVFACTEVDGLDEVGEKSREASKVRQMEGRTRAFSTFDKLVYLECTASIEEGCIWQEYLGGTQSRIMLPCPHCGAWVLPEREHLAGWQEAASDLEALECGRFVCPACDLAWSEAERYAANLQGRLIHRGQEITPGGQIVGEEPRTTTLGFRWSAVHNMLVSAGDCAKQEWDAARATDRDAAEREMLQWVWSLPAASPTVDLTPLDPAEVSRRTGGLKKGIVPQAHEVVAVGCDTHLGHLDWSAQAWTGVPTGQVIEYGVHPVELKQSAHAALICALTDWSRYILQGWRDESGRLVLPTLVWIDSGYARHTDAVYEFCRSANAELGGRTLFFPSKGYGVGQRRMHPYNAPAKTSQDVRYIGREYYLTRVRRAGVWLAHVNADAWKTELHTALALEPGSPGSLVLWAGTPGEHDDFGQQITAEKKVETFVQGKGEILSWERIRRANHQLDANYTAMAAAHYAAAVRLQERSQGQGAQTGWFANQQRRAR